MDEQLEKLVSEYQDLYTDPTETRSMELEDKVADLEFEGQFLAAPKTVKAYVEGIPILAVTRRSDLQEWQAELKLNSFVIYSDLERGTTDVSLLYKKPSKPMKSQIKVKGRKPELGEGFTTGVVRHIIGESRSEPMLPGAYAVTLIYWDKVSNQRLVLKNDVPNSVEKSHEPVEWPWDHWANTALFKSTPASPKLERDHAIAVTLTGPAKNRSLVGTLATKARPLNIILPDPKRPLLTSVIAGIHVDILLLTLDKPAKLIRISVPILGSSSIKAGDLINGWFTIPFPFEPSAEDRILYALADGMITGPVRIAGDLP